MSADVSLSSVGYFAHEQKTVVDNRFNRWLIPPAALAVHLCIGMAYGFSVFWLPLSHALGAGHTLPYTSNANPFSFLFDTQYNWTVSLLGWTYTLFFVFLGSSAALWGAWLERVGPRKAGIVAAFCWCGGLMLAAIAVYFHQLWLLWLGAGVIGGIGLGLGYISPVSTLLKWFPDRRGMAAGLAIMGFGGGALIGAPLAEQLMAFYATSTSVGVWETLLTLAFLYFIFMMAGALNYRLPPDNWQPAVSDKLKTQQQQSSNKQYVPVSVAWKTPQFWLLWLVLCLNVSAGIGIIGMASPMLQEVFAGHLLGVERSFDNLTLLQKGKITAMAAGFTGFLSLFNIAGRFVWASCSDYWGRKRTYAVFLALGSLLYATVPVAAHGDHIAWFILIFCILLSMYGGGFATIPAYLADLFGTRMVGAIHGRLLTAWAAAGLLGPLLINSIRDYQVAHGVSGAAIYDITLRILSVLLALGFICNLLIRPVSSQYFCSAPVMEEPLFLDKPAPVAAVSSVSILKKSGYSWLRVVAAWLMVCLPLLWGLCQSVEKVKPLFQH